MSKPKSSDYFAVPGDAKGESLPIYTEANETQITINCKPLKLALIGSAIALLGLIQFSYQPIKSYVTEMKQFHPMAEDTSDRCFLGHSDQSKELRSHMGSLSESFSNYEHMWTPCMEKDAKNPPNGPNAHEFDDKDRDYPVHEFHGHGEHDDHKDNEQLKYHNDVTDEDHDEEGLKFNNKDKRPKLHPSQVGNKDQLAPSKTHRGKPFCTAQDLEASSTIFSFSPEDFHSIGISSKSKFSPGSHIRVSKSADDSVKAIVVNVTVYAGQKELWEDTKVSAFDSKGQYTIQIERGHDYLSPPNESESHEKDEESLHFPSIDHHDEDSEPPHYPPHPPKKGKEPPHHPPHPPKEGEEPHPPPPPPKEGEEPPHHPPHPPKKGEEPPHHPPHPPKEGEEPHPHPPPKKGEKPPPHNEDQARHPQEGSANQFNSEENDMPALPTFEENKEDCLYYEVEIIFPATLTHYDGLIFQTHDSLIQSGTGLENIEFGVIKAGIDHGAIRFNTLRANKVILGVLDGSIEGKYQTAESFLGGVIHGPVDVQVEPQSENLNITATSAFGPVSVRVPGDKYAGEITLFSHGGASSAVQATNPEYVHVTTLEHDLLAGFYRRENSESHIIVEATTHGGESLIFY